MERAGARGVRSGPILGRPAPVRHWAFGPFKFQPKRLSQAVHRAEPQSHESCHELSCAEPRAGLHCLLGLGHTGLLQCDRAAGP